MEPGRWLWDAVLPGFGRSPSAQEGVWYQRGFKNGMRKTRNSQQLCLWASTFCPKSSKFFAFFKNKLPKADTTLAYMCVEQPAAPLCYRGRGELRAGSCPTTPACTIAICLGGRGELAWLGGRNQSAEGLLYQRSATEVGITYHPVLDRSRRCPALSDGQTIWKAPQLPPKSTGSTAIWHREKKGLCGVFSMATENVCGANP